MAIDRTGSAAPLLPTHGLGDAVDRHAEALADVQDAVDPAVRVDLSADALATMDRLTPEQAVAESIATSHALDANAAVVRAEDERFAALVFLLAHHGPPLQ